MTDAQKLIDRIVEDKLPYMHVTDKATALEMASIILRTPEYSKTLQVEAWDSYTSFINNSVNQDGPKDVPLKSLVDFSDLYKLFSNTHSHLPAYSMVDKDLQLKGDAYYPIKKAMCYMVESLRQQTVSFLVGSELGDNRMHIAEMVSGGRGKGQQRKLITQYDRGEYESVPTFQPTRTHVEQLIGKIVHTKKEAREERGFFGYKGLIVDECQTFICEEDKALAALMLDFRNAMEVYTKNTVEKKLTAENMMRYYPETRFLMLMHPITLPATFFDHGTARRLFMFKIDIQKIPESAAYSSILTPPPTKALRDYINDRNDAGTPVFDDDARNELVEWIMVWTHFVLTHPNQRIRAIGQRHFTSLKLQFIRSAAILSMQKQEFVVSKKTVAQASLDTIHFLLCTYEVYANQSTLNLSRDVWRTTDQQEAMVFEWMNWNGALSRESSKLSIEQVETHIGEVFGVQDRQAKGIFSRLVEQGLLARKQGQHDSKAWLGFYPALEGGIDFDVTGVKELSIFLDEKIVQFGLRDVRSAEDIGVSQNARIHAESTDNIGSVNINNSKTPPTIAPLAPLDSQISQKPQQPIAPLAPLKRPKPINMGGASGICPSCGCDTTSMWDYAGKWVCLDCLKVEQDKNTSDPT